MRGLWIDTTNSRSERVAERAGYVREGVLRSYWFKEEIRRDFGVWSRSSNSPRGELARRPNRSLWFVKWLS